VAGGPVEPRRILYGRRRGRRLRTGQRHLVETLLPRLAIDLASAPDLIAPAGLFEDAPREVWLEIGFGAGEHLAVQARANPGIGLIGCEPYLNGVVRLLTAIEAEGRRNIRILRDDARLLVARLAAASIGRVFILFPDPWPKARHHKRRMVSPAMLAGLARVMAAGAELRIATDDGGYLAAIVTLMHADGNFEWLARRPDDWRRRPADWPATRYEEKALAAGRRPAFLRYRRVARDAAAGPRD
jgi:tRNA (guanine-N7-)-methyltransferase